jgi:ubiquitin carboxyl-terminal hydrolase L3
MPLESDPDLMNRYIAQLGVDVSKWCFHEVLGTDEDLLGMCPQPVLAVLMLFPLTEPQEQYAKEEEERIQKKGQTESKNIWYMQQTVGNACGTTGLLHSVLNNASKLGLDNKKFFAKFLNETKSMTPAQRAEALERNEDIEVQHEQVAEQGGSEVESKTNENLHFIAFVRMDGQLYELDGCKSRPINHGQTSEQTLLQDAAKVIRQFMKRDPKDIRFNLVALAPKTAEDDD